MTEDERQRLQAFLNETSSRVNAVAAGALISLSLVTVAFIWLLSQLR